MRFSQARKEKGGVKVIRLHEVNQIGRRKRKVEKARVKVKKIKKSRKSDARGK